MKKMKIRICFVSNSSSASFSIKKDNLTFKQYNMIINHADELSEKYDAWIIYEDDNNIYCYTYMDNFDFLTFVKNKVMVDANDICNVQYG